jgi:hypothetical protein
MAGWWLPGERAKTLRVSMRGGMGVLALSGVAFSGGVQ